MSIHRLTCANARSYQGNRAPICGCAECGMKWLHSELLNVSARVQALEKENKELRHRWSTIGSSMTPFSE